MKITKEELNGKLKTKYSSKGLRKEALAKLTDIVYSQITEESTDEEIETFIEGVEPYVSIVQSEIDFVKTKKPKEGESGEQTGGAGATDTKDDDDDQTPTWAKKLFDRIDKLEGDKVSTSRKSQLDKALEGLTDAQKRGYSRMKLDSYTDEEFTAEIANITTEADELRTENTQRGVIISPPRVGGNNPQLKEAPKKEVDALADTFNL